VRGSLLLFLGSALLLTIRLAVAETQFRRDPDLAAQTPYWLRAPNLAGYESSPAELRASVSLNPRLSSAWIHLGLDAEGDGNLAEAESDLLQAARFDHQYLPAWTLANYYFRRGDSAKFWPWAQRAAVLTYDDYRPLLRLADTLETSPQMVATRLGGDSRLLRAYMDVLIGFGQLDKAGEIARLLEARHEPADRARLVDLAYRVANAH